MQQSENKEKSPKYPQQKLSRTDAAYARLKDRIISGALPPGEQIDAARLSDDLEFGRTPVREALLRLQAEGIVEIIPKRGVRIVSLSADDLTEIYQVISAIEVEAARLLAETKPTMSDLSDLSEAVERMAAAARANDREAWALADEAFHRRLLDLNPNLRLRDVGITHRDLAQRSHFVALRMLTPEQRLRSAEQHRDLIQLIASGEGAAVAARHRDQRARGAEMLVTVLREHHLSRL